MDQPRRGTKSHRTTKCAQVPPHPQGCPEQAAEHGHGAAPCPSPPWGLQQLPSLVPGIPFPLQLPASGASGMMKHHWQVFHTWFLCLLTSGGNHLSASAGYESPDWELPISPDFHSSRTVLLPTHRARFGDTFPTDEKLLLPVLLRILPRSPLIFSLSGRRTDFLGWGAWISSIIVIWTGQHKMGLNQTHSQQTAFLSYNLNRPFRAHQKEKHHKASNKLWWKPSPGLNQGFYLFFCQQHHENAVYSQVSPRETDKKPHKRIQISFCTCLLYKPIKN